MWSDPADSPRAAFESHPVDSMEPEPERDLELMADALRRLFQWIIEPVKQVQYGRITERLNMRRVYGRSVAVIYITTPELQRITQEEMAERMGITKQSFNLLVSAARDRFGFQTRTMRSQSGRDAMRHAALSRRKK